MSTSRKKLVHRFSPDNPYKAQLTYFELVFSMPSYYAGLN